MFYKYINLLFRFVIGIVAVWLIYLKISDDFIDNLNDINFELLKWPLLILTTILMLLNWGIEAAKWRFAIRNVSDVGFIKAMRLTFTGITIGLLTPNRIGEIPARAALLKTNFLKDVILKTAVSSFSQVVITFLLGGLGLMLTQDYFNLVFNPFWVNLLITVVLIILIIIYFNLTKISFLFKLLNFLGNDNLIKSLVTIKRIDLVYLLLFSLLRYLVFFLQYWLVLLAFNVKLSGINELLLIPVCFLFTSSIPTLLISEIGVRGSVAILVFGVVSDLSIQIIMASVLLWLINVSLPALLGFYDLKEFKLIKEK